MRLSLMSLLAGFALALSLGLGCAEEDADPQTCAAEGEQPGELDCCEGLLVDFTNTCYPCVPLGQMRTIDGPGCCDDLVTTDPNAIDLTCVEP